MGECWLCGDYVGYLDCLCGDVVVGFGGEVVGLDVWGGLWVGVGNCGVVMVFGV